MLLLLAVGSLVACQGVSAGGGSTNSVGSLSLGSPTLSFGNLAPGSSKTLTVRATNSGSASVTISSATISAKYFSLTAPSLPTTLATGQSANLTVQFEPTATGSFSATATITSNASDAVASLSLSGTGTAGGQLTPSQASEAFGTVTVGSSNQALAETVTNAGRVSVTISQVGISGTGFSLSGITTPLTLSAGQSAGFNVSFAPQSAGSASGTVTITSDASNPTLNIPLSGAGTTSTGQLSVTPGALGLGNVVAGTSGTASGNLTASGANVTVTAARTNNSVFSVGGLSLPVTIPAGQNAPFNVTFSPQTAGAAGASLIFTSNAQPATTTEALTGTGSAAPTHTVNLSWNASSSPNICGYNVYRAAYVTSCGSFSRINTGLDTGTLYSDPSVTDGAKYCYATTAVNTSNQESGYSNIVSKVQIPAP